jgi:hypothetical protein
VGLPYWVETNAPETPKHLFSLSYAGVGALIALFGNALLWGFASGGDKHWAHLEKASLKPNLLCPIEYVYGTLAPSAKKRQTPVKSVPDRCSCPNSGSYRGSFWAILVFLPGVG